MTPDRGSARRRPVDAALTDERRQLIYRYMEEGDELEELDELDEPEPELHDEPVLEVEAAGPYLATAEATVVRLPSPDPSIVRTDGDGNRARRGRPPGRKVRRQVHFHVDADQDRMLLSAAGRFGSQQKALIAALQSLNEVQTLREQVVMLEAECERQRRLLAEAEALFKTT